MQNMERYFGFEVSVLDELDPVRVDILKDRAEKIIAQHDFNPDEYFVYFHQISLRRTKDEHFGIDGGVGARLKKLELTFGVNPKQQRKKTIKLFNFLLDEESPRRIKWSGDVESVTYHIDGNYLAEHLGFRNELITFISKTVKDRHRKLKISVVAYPTDEFSRHIFKKTNQHLTQIDYPFRAPVILRVPRYRNIILSANQDYQKGNNRMGDNYTFNGPTQVNALGNYATATGTTNQQINSMDIGALQKQLAKLQSALEKRTDTSEHETELNAIKQAQIAANNDDPNGIMTSLGKAGNWAMETAKEVGVDLVVDLLKGFIQ